MANLAIRMMHRNIIYPSVSISRYFIVIRPRASLLIPNAGHDEKNKRRRQLGTRSVVG